MFRTVACRFNPDNYQTPSKEFYRECYNNTNSHSSQESILTTLRLFKSQGVISQKCYQEFKDQPGSCQKFQQCPKLKIKNYCLLQSKREIKAQIFFNGPVIGVLKGYRDLTIYNSGLFDVQYKEIVGKMLVVKVVGWGSEEGKEY